MIDIHCHMLPGLDDGPSTLETSVAMARLAVEDGIRGTVCTPHVFDGRFECTRPRIEHALEEPRSELQRQGVPLKLCLGADTRVDPRLLDSAHARDVKPRPGLAAVAKSLLFQQGFQQLRREHHLPNALAALQERM
ncbi:MAG: CpsB/CapC family capsule biosynthesis tyrosine phosphatase, partial [Planctomycetota bacterium]